MMVRTGVDGSGIAPPQLQLRALTKSFGTIAALYPTDLRIEPQEFVTVLGPSGCGKSTLLRMIMGITPATAGEIRLRGNRIDQLPPERRDIAMVFQSYALFPFMTVRKNLSFGMRMKRVSPIEQRRRLGMAVEMCGLHPFLDRLPRDLSGGQQQRVALARAVVMQPSLLLLDEPLSSLDAGLRDALREHLLILHREAGTTSLYVTHDQTEAMTMSDRIIIMNAGRVVEVAAPATLYSAPRSRFAASLIGQANLFEIEAEAAGGTAQLPWGQVVRTARRASGPTVACVRPEQIDLVPDADGAGTVIGRQFHGPVSMLRVAIGGTDMLVSLRGEGHEFVPGCKVTPVFPQPLHLLDADSLPAAGTVG